MAKPGEKRAEDDESENVAEPVSEAERVRTEIERVRARVGVDPAVPRRWLAGAWSAPSGAIEEDEAELVDVLADCLSAGLRLGDAVASWTSGGLARSEEADDEGEADKEPVALAAVLSGAGQRRSGRRITIR